MRLSLPASLLVAVCVSATSAADPDRDAAIAALQKSGVSVSGLTFTAKEGGPMIALGTGTTGGENNSGTDENLALVARIPEVERVYLYKGKFTAAGFAKLTALPNLKTLNLYGVTVEPTAFAELAGCKSLASVQIGAYPVTDEVLAHLGKIGGLTRFESTDNQKLSAKAVTEFLRGRTDLRAFLLFGNGLDDSGVKELGRMKNLTRLWSDSTSVTPGGWAPLAALTAMTDLNLNKTTFDDAALKGVAGMTKLESLILNSTKVTDAGMPAVAGMTALHDLGLEGTGVTDAGMVHLRKLTELQNLYLGGTSVTAKGLSQVPVKNKMVMMRAGQRAMTAKEFLEMRELFPETQLFDPTGYWTPEREKAAMKELGKEPPVKK